VQAFSTFLSPLSFKFSNVSQLRQRAFATIAEQARDFVGYIRSQDPTQIVMQRVIKAAFT